MFVLFNGNSIPKEEFQLPYSQAFFTGKVASQKFLIHKSKVFLLEESYFNLMATMRKLRLSIPMSFTVEFFETEIHKLLSDNAIENTTVVVTVFDSQILFSIDSTFYHEKSEFIIDIYKEIHVSSSYLHAQPIISPDIEVAKHYAAENELDDVVLLNHDKTVARTTLGNLYAIQNDVMYKIPSKLGAYTQAIDSYLEKVISEKLQLSLEVKSISPFELQNMDEMFISIEGFGLQSVTKIRSKSIRNTVTKLLAQNLLNS